MCDRFLVYGIPDTSEKCIVGVRICSGTGAMKFKLWALSRKARVFGLVLLVPPVFLNSPTGRSKGDQIRLDGGLEKRKRVPSSDTQENERQYNEFIKKTTDSHCNYKYAQIDKSIVKVVNATNGCCNQASYSKWY